MNNCTACQPCLPCANCVGKAKHELCHGCDGPITDFVLISRAVRLGFAQKYSEEIISNALIEAMQEYGFVKPVEDSGWADYSNCQFIWLLQ